MKAVILTAGKSTGLLPFSETRPKSMIFIAGEYILETTIRQLKDAGIRDIILVINSDKNFIKNYFESGNFLGVNIEYVVQNKEGIGNAIAACQDLLKGESNFVLVYGDSLVSKNHFINMLTDYSNTAAKALAVISHPISEGAYGNVYLNHQMHITKLIEKPEDNSLSNYVLTGRFILPDEIFIILKNCNFDMVASLSTLIEKKYLKASFYEENWIDINRPWNIFSANQMMMDCWDESLIHSSVEIEANVNIKYTVHIGKNVKIGAGTTIVGPCYIGSNVYIGNGSLIREYSSIGPGSIIGYGCEIKNAILFGNAKIGRLSFIGDSVIGTNVNLGAGTITANNYSHSNNKNIMSLFNNQSVDTGLTKLGAFIGDNTTIGIGHSLAPGIKIAANRKIDDHISIQE